MAKPRSRTGAGAQRKTDLERPKHVIIDVGPRSAFRFEGDVHQLATAIGGMDRPGRPHKVQVILVPETDLSSKMLERMQAFQRIRKGRSLPADFGLKGAGAPLVRLEGPTPVAFDFYTPDARAKAILRGKAHANDDLKAAGGAYDVEQVRTLMNGISRQAVDRKVKDGALLAVPGPSGKRRFPTVQFNADGSVVAGLKAVQQALGFSSPWAVLNFLVNENDRLGGREPIEVLRGGQVEAVVTAAASVGVQGA